MNNLNLKTGLLVFPLLMFGAAAVVTPPALAHDIAMNDDGCHQEDKGSGYHCHAGKFNGLRFDSKRELDLLSSGKVGKAKPKKRRRARSKKAPARAANANSGKIELYGKAKAITGDTIKIGATRIALFGVDAPELGQSCTENREAWKCGREARTALTELIDGQSVNCERKDVKGSKTIFAVCRAGKIILNAAMAQRGWVVTYHPQTKEYEKYELVARISKVGVWRGPFVKPWEWRKGKR